jgi:hypothetical protein
MSQARTIRSTLSLCLLAVMAVSAPSWAGPVSSRFIQNLPADMKPDSQGPGAMRWEAPNHNIAKYDKVMIEPLTIYIAPDSKEQGLEPDSLKSLADAFRAIVINKLEPKYPVVDKPGKGVLVLRPALTNVYVDKKSRGLLSITPVGLVVYAARDDYAKKYSLDKAAMEFEALDGESGERVAILIDPTPEKSGYREEPTLNWTVMETTLNIYADRLVKRLDSSRGK